MKPPERLWSAVVEEPLDIASLTDAFSQTLQISGAVGHFIGRVKKQSSQQKDQHKKSVPSIQNLFIETYHSMAEGCLKTLVEQTHHDYPVEAIWLVHRVGLMFPGEPIVLVCVGALYRKETASAMANLVEGIKTRIPCWKKETYTNHKTAWLSGVVPQNS